MPHFPPNQFPHFTGPNFSVSNDRVLDHLRVQQPNTFKVPPATKNLIDPNVPVDPAADPIVLIGDNDPVTNETLRSGVAQAGALVYSTTPIIASNPLDGCFDGRNHLYFSDGDQWIPLANCLPNANEGRYGDPQQGERFFQNNSVPTDTITPDEWKTVQGARENEFSNEYFFKPDGDEAGDYWIEYTGKEDITAKVSVAASWKIIEDTQDNNYSLCGMSIYKENYKQDNLEATASLLSGTTAQDLSPTFNVSLNGYVDLETGDKLRIKVNNGYVAVGPYSPGSIIVVNMNFNVKKV